MKIIHFHPDSRMAEKFVVPLMEAERASGYQTYLICSVCRLGHESKCVPFDLTASNFLGLPLALWKIIRFLKSIRPDLIFSHNTKSSFVPLLGGWLAGVHVRVYFNHGVPYVGYRGLLRWLLRVLELCNTVLATHVVTVSEDMIPLLQDVNSRIKPQIIQSGSACGIDLHAFSGSLYNRTDWRLRNDLLNEDLIVVYVGRPEIRKGFGLVLKMWAEHFQEGHIKLILCGPGPDEVLKHLNSVPSNVIPLGFVNNISEVLCGSDIMILPSKHEGLSYACMEAQAAGVTPIANDIDGVRCLIQNDVTGFLVPNNDISKYVEIIRRIDKDKGTIARVKVEAQRRVSRFSREKFMSSYLSFLSDLRSK